MKKTPNFFLLAGTILILCSSALVFLHQFRMQRGQTLSAELAGRIEAILPERSQGYPEMYSDPDMPVLQLEGTDFCGLLEVPAYGITLPIGGIWDTAVLSSYPCRFWGSVYDGTLILGGADQDGQFAFCARTNPGDYVTVTDMLGNEFDFVVARVDRSDTAEYEKLSAGGYPLTLFTRSAFGLEYILVRCEYPFN